MILALVQGVLGADAVERTSANGRRFWTGSVRTAVGEETAWVSFITFDEVAGVRLVGLGKGQPVALAGEMRLNIWSDRTGVEHRDWKLTVADVLTLHQARKVRDRGPAGVAKP